VASAVFLCFLTLGMAASGAPSLKDDLAELLRSTRPVAAGLNAAVNAPGPVLTGPPQVSLGEDGFIHYVGAPAGHEFAVENAAPGQPALNARHFLNRHRRVFGINSVAVDFAVLKQKQRNGRHYVRFQQTYRGLPVFAAQTTVQVNARDAVECVLNDIEHDVQSLDTKRVAIVPTLTAEKAANRAKVLMAPEANGDELDTKPAQLAIFSPGVVGEAGNPRLVWDLIVFSVASRQVRERVLIDCHTGDLAFRYPLVHSEIQRKIYDYSQPITFPDGSMTWHPVRTEGDPPVPNPQANAAYDYIGATYAFYLNQHGRTNWDPYSSELDAWVRYCPNTTQCPWVNAEYDSLSHDLHFGDFQVADDVVAHEYTHGITDFESGLIYRNASGAMNESFSDIWGEYVDLTLPAGNDNASVRWLVSEDTPDGPVRNMKDPTLFSNPDRLNSPLYLPPPAQPSQQNDYGGVHSNSGVLNKLCYLLTDGDYFNGYGISGMGIARIADLFYEVNANLLPSAPDWGDLYDALRQAAINLGWTKVETDNLCRACLAVEIALRPRNLFVDKSAVGCPSHDGSQNCGLFRGPVLTVAQGVNAISPGDNLWVRVGSYNEPLSIGRTLTLRPYDGQVTIGR
jgi:Zn-dependent metalloprotease